MTNSPLSFAPEKRGLGARMRDAFRHARGRHRHEFLLSACVFFALLIAAVYLQVTQVHRKQQQRAETESTQNEVVPRVPEFTEIVGSFQRNETITQVLLQQGLPVEMIHQIVDAARPVYDLAKVRAEQLYYVCFTGDGKFRNLRYPVDDERYLTVYHDAAENRMIPVMKNFQYETRVEHISAEIESSLFASVMSIGEEDQLALDLAEIFGSDIDFHTDLQKSDSFRVLIEKKYLDGKFSKNGAILAADFTNQGKELTGIRFEDENGKPAYYAPDGKALKKSFLKSPLKFGRITSKFSLARRHPILKIVRPHLGVDYAAPTGTPVQSVAAGVVTSAARNKGSGNMVKIRHSGGYETMYLHLSRIAVKAGARVAQGDVIGNVGSTGLSTGPHLDFRIRQNGKAINPAKVIFPPGAPVSAARFASFAARRDTLMDDLRSTVDDSRQASVQSDSPPAK